MRALNDLSKQERLELYRKALKDWQERPSNYEAKTISGLCKYMTAVHQILSYTESADLCQEWANHVKANFKGNLPYIAGAFQPKPRIAALKAMIAQLEEELK